MPGPYRATATKNPLLPRHGEAADFLLCILRQHEALQRPDAQNQDAQGDAVPAEGGKGMLLHVVHQEANGQHGDHESHNAAYQQGRNLGQGEHTALGQELDKLEARRTRHDRDGQEEGELGRAGAAHAAEQAANDGRAAAGRAGDDRQ